jgi:hypothetical protein
MALSSYAELQDSVLNWLARPGDPLVAPFVPDMVRLFESEATRRLRVGGAETKLTLVASGTPVLGLPADCCQVRFVAAGGVVLNYVTPSQLPGGGGEPSCFTIYGNTFLVLGPAPSGDVEIEILYQSGVPPLSDSNPSNWLLASAPDCYLYGTLAGAAAFIGHDERIPLWLQGRDAAFASIEQADRKARWSGSPLQIRVHGITDAGGSAGSGGAVALPPTSAVVFIGDTPPATPKPGVAWWDSVGGQLYLWFVDPSGPGQWVPATN